MTNFIILFISFLFMEFIAWFTHKYIMHGFLWVLHKDHHAPAKKRLEKNDLFAIIFAIPSILLILNGVQNHMNASFWIGLGIAFYGLSYFLFHDILYHRRIKLLNPTINRYFRVVVKAHGDHHAGKKNFGFLFMFPWKYFREIK